MSIDTKWVCDRVRLHDSCMVDLGSFDGGNTKLMAARFPNAVVHSFEADPTNFKVLKSACEDIPNVVCHNVAIGDCECDVPMYVMRHKKYHEAGLTSQSNSLFKGFIAGKTHAYKEVMVPGTTMDQFCTTNQIVEIGLLKINCEGCEYKIFDATLDFLKFTDVISLAMHGKELFSGGEFEEAKIQINNILLESFDCIFGQPITKRRPKKDRWNHALQVWVKRK